MRWLHSLFDELYVLGRDDFSEPISIYGLLASRTPSEVPDEFLHVSVGDEAKSRVLPPEIT